MKNTKIFIIGFNRTATRTLHYFFKSNGLLSVHWDNDYLVKHFEKNLKNNLPLLGDQKVFNTKVNSDCTYKEAIVFSDMTYNLLNKDAKDYYKILDRQYKDSKFILNFRNEKDWIKSRLKHSTVAADQCKFHNCSINELSKIWSKLFRNHIKDTEKYFKDREGDLLKFNMVLKKLLNFYLKPIQILMSNYGIISSRPSK